ncbi:hypothetical protein D9M70_644580 [compost metagenome]
MADQLCALVMHSECWGSAAVGQSLNHARWCFGGLFGNGYRALLIVIVDATLTASGVPERKQRAGVIQQIQLPTGINTVRHQGLIAQAIDCRQVRFRRCAPEPWITRDNQAPRRIENLPGDA